MGKPIWRCFFCNQVFTREVDAAEHFGTTLGAQTACQIKGHEHDLLHVIRKQEAELARLRAEDTDLTRAMASMQYEHAEALRRAEETGYNRGVRDMNDHIAGALV